MTAHLPIAAGGLMNIHTVDWAVIIGFIVSVIVVGSVAARRASKSSADFFLSGRTMPWWLLGVSMVACTFSCDTPNLVTDIVRKDGVSGNWVWWAYLLTGMMTVFIYAKLWRRSALNTDLGFYEMRYHGKTAAFLRGFRALYLGIFFNVMIMGTVSLAAIKIGQVIFGLSPVQALFWSMAGVAIYATLGGLTGSIWADFYQYSVAMAGAILAAVFCLKIPEVGGLSGLFANPNVSENLRFFPSLAQQDFFAIALPILIMPIAIQWWSTWYPGAEPGGGGYIAQRMLSAKNEKHAVGAVMLFNFLHYAVRPWPWIIVALASLAIYPMEPRADRAAARAELNTPEVAAAIKQLAASPDAVPADMKARIAALNLQKDGLTKLTEAYAGKVDAQFLKHDICYPAMISKMPVGLLGLIVASLIAAYMSTIATHLNWGSSYFVYDFWKRYARPGASEKELVLVGRLSMLSLLLLSALVALWLKNAKDSFDILLQIGAGTGLIYILRWFWWRINALTEISAMVFSFAVALFFKFGLPDLHLPEGHWLTTSHWQLITGVGATTLVWVIVTLLTPHENKSVLREFYRKVQPGGPGWRKVVEEAAADGDNIVTDKGWDVPVGLVCMALGCLAIWSSLFCVGSLLYGRMALGLFLGAVAAVSLFTTMKLVAKIRMH
jgi:Na+/proline symporter